jgi:hypothetical protein
MDILRSFHLHMISDSTGETLITIAKAVRVQYAQVRAIEHLHPLVRSRRELARVVRDVEAAPGIVLYTLFNRELAEELERACKRLNVPCVPALKPILQVFESYLGTPATPTVGGQHVLDADYFRRIEALNFTMLHDDGHLPQNLNDADIGSASAAPLRRRLRSISPIAASRPRTCRSCQECRSLRSSKPRPAPLSSVSSRAPSGSRKCGRTG